MTDLKISVTAPLIERATARDSRHCMIAQAILAARPDFRSVMVDVATIRWSNPRTKKRYVCLTPELAAAELVKFDRGEPIEPFDLNLHAIQVTAMTQQTETTTEAHAAGRAEARRKSQPRTRTITGRATNPLVVGGRPLPTGHLSNDPRGAAASWAEPPAESSNVTRSGRRYRQYGRRLLAD